MSEIKRYIEEQDIKFINYNGASGYARVMYNDVKNANDKTRIEVMYNGKDVKAVLEYFFNLEDRINKAIDYIKEQGHYCIIEDEGNCLCDLQSTQCDYLLDILRGNDEK